MDKAIKMELAPAQIEKLRTSLAKVEQNRLLLWQRERHRLLLLGIPILIFIVLVGIEGIRSFTHVESPIDQDAAIQQWVEPIKLVEELVHALQIKA